ncbi:hypothetical protein M422DRAFT_187138, partial [Sphaerobolus stellatus SS14]
PSSSALCANIGPNVTSPIHLIPLTLVSYWSSIMTRPLLSISTPMFSRFNPLVYGRRPMATRRISASI